MTETLRNGGDFLIRETDCRTLFTPADFTDEHRQIAATTEQFVADRIQPVNEDIEAGDFELVVARMRECAGLGLMLIDVPEEYGGLELDKVTSMLVMEKMAFARNFGLTYMAHTGIGMLPLIYYGTAEQKERYLGRLAAAEMLGAYCLTEPGSGSDALGAKSAATLSDDGKYYTLDGTKQFSTNSGFADLLTVFAKVDKVHFTAFLVERGTPGLSFGPEERKMGLHGSSTRQVILDKARVPVENLLGEVGRGHKIAFNVLNVGRFKLGALCVGQMKYALAEGASYANERRQFNAPIASFGAIREKLADVTALTFAAESVVYRLAGMIDDRLATLDRQAAGYYTRYQQGIEEYAAECAMVKVFCSEAAAAAIDEMLQVHGGYGYIVGHPIEQLYRDERVQRIYEGTNEINRLLIPGLLLRKGLGNRTSHGLPKNAGSGEFATEKRLLQGMKSIYLALSGLMAQTFGPKAAAEQEIMLALADAAIEIFALESAVLRAEKDSAAATDGRKALFRAAAMACAFRTRQRFAMAAEKCAVYAGDDALRASIHATLDYDGSGLLTAKRLLAKATGEAERYIF
ncbi:MAG: acyl-CoA dehydrogenase [Desulfobulbaceae bacterium]|nr:MAG: acyl-CoA dehydrogenase [Desulfobulbaceae bacterium]